VKALRRIATIAIVLLLIAGGIWFAMRPRPVEVVVATVERGAVEATVANTRAGTINQRRRAKLAPAMGGQVEALHVKEGDRVQAGQVLLELWNDDLKAQLALAKGEVERATALAEEARLRAELAEREAHRQQDLLQREVSAGERADRTEMEAKAQRAAESAAVAEAAARRLQIAVVEAQLVRTVVRAPFAGVVAEVNAEVGEFVTPSPIGVPTPPAVDLIDDSEPYVTAPIDEVDAAQVRLGMPARITLDAFGKRTFAGRVRRIAPYVLDREKQARTVDIEVEFAVQPQDLTLLAGYSADVEILLVQHADVVRVPTEALRDGTVFVRAQDGTLLQKKIEVGLANWRFTEVTAGLDVGAQIVLSRDRKGVVDGARVAVEGGGDDAARNRP